MDNKKQQALKDLVTEMKGVVIDLEDIVNGVDDITAVEAEEPTEIIDLSGYQVVPHDMFGTVPQNAAAAIPSGSDNDSPQEVRDDG